MTKRQRQNHFEEHDEHILRHNRKKKSEPSFRLQHISPMTYNQERAFQFWRDGQNLLLTGSPGAGKTFLALYFALSEIAKGEYKKVYLYRSAVSSRDQGFLPGSPKEKAKVFEAPYFGICSNLYGRGDAYDVLKGKQTIEFGTTSYIRGITVNDAIIVVDEVQNLSFHECNSIITRAGDNTRVIFSGDFHQSDLNGREKSGIQQFEKIASRMPSFSCVEFGIEDCVRSGLVREYLFARHELGI